jgi:hypothetical protein
VSDRLVYGTAPATAARGVGVGAVGLGVVVLSALLVAALSPPAWLGVALAVVLGVAAVVLLVVLGTALARLAGRGPRLVVDEEGFDNRTGLRVGVRRATWREVKHLRAEGRTLVVELRDGRQSLIDSRVLDVPPPDLADDLRRRLDRGHGYHPLR